MGSNVTGQALEDRLTMIMYEVRKNPSFPTYREQARYVMSELEYWGFVVNRPSVMVVEAPVAQGQVGRRLTDG